MNDRDVVNYLLIKEIEISNRIHESVREILRLGYESERGKAQISNMIESIQYILEDVKKYDILDNCLLIRAKGKVPRKDENGKCVGFYVPPLGDDELYENCKMCKRFAHYEETGNE